MAESILESLQWAEAMTGEHLGLETDTVAQMAADYKRLGVMLELDPTELAQAIIDFSREHYVPILGLNAGFAAAGLDTGFWAGVRWATENDRG